MILERVADIDDENRQAGQRLAAEHFFENLLELRNDEHEQEAHDRDRDEEHDDWIEHRGDDLVLDFLRLFLKLGETVEHEFQHTAEFAGFHHVDVELVKNFRVLCEAL